MGNKNDDRKDKNKKDENKKCENKKEKDKNGLLTEFDFDEFNQNQNPTPSPFISLIPLANTDICIDDKCDRVLLNAAINWEPTGTRTTRVDIGRLSFSGFVGRTRVRFTIWRGNPSNSNSNAEPICSFIDSSPETIFLIETIDINPETPDFQPGLSIVTGFSPVTTDFKCVDENPKCGKVEYFLTMNILDILPGEISLTGATAVTFTAMEIEKHDDDDCCDCR